MTASRQMHMSILQEQTEWLFQEVQGRVSQ